MYKLVDSWKLILFKPRETIKFLSNNDKNYYVIALGILSGIAWKMADYDEHISLPTLQTLFIIFIGGALTGLIRLYLGSWFLYISGKVLKGRASIEDIRLVYAWSSVPDIIFIFAMYFLVTYYPNIYIADDFLQKTWIDITFIIFFLVSMIVSILWSILILLQGLSEVQDFSLWFSVFSVAVTITTLVGLGVGFVMLLQALS